MVNLKTEIRVLVEKKKLRQWRKGYLLLLSLVILGCGPQHHYAVEQFNANPEGAILSIQGYVVDSAKVRDLERDWNQLVREMSNKPGFISSSLSEGVGDSKLVLAHSKWKDLKSLRDVFLDEKIVELEAKLPKIQFEHLFNVGTLGDYHK